MVPHFATKKLHALTIKTVHLNNANVNEIHQHRSLGGGVPHRNASFSTS